jgi:hypothetical protein
VPQRRVVVFFYGLFMDAELLRGKGLSPQDMEVGSVPGMSLRIGQRAALVSDHQGRTYGVIMSLAWDELERLYSEPGVQGVSSPSGPGASREWWGGQRPVLQPAGTASTRRAEPGVCDQTARRCPEGWFAGGLRGVDLDRRKTPDARRQTPVASHQLSAIRARRLTTDD